MHIKKNVWGITAGLVIAVMLLCPWCAVNLIADNEWMTLLKIGGTLLEFGVWFGEAGLALMGIALIVLLTGALALLIVSSVIMIADLCGNAGDKAVNAAEAMHRIAVIVTLFLTAATFIVCIWANATVEMNALVCGPCPFLTTLAGILGIVMCSSGGNKHRDVRIIRDTSVSIHESLSICEKEITSISDTGSDTEFGYVSLTNGTVLREIEDDAVFWARHGLVNEKCGMPAFKKQYPGYVHFSMRRNMRGAGPGERSVGDNLFSGGAYIYCVRDCYSQVGLHAETDGSSIGSIFGGERVLVSGRAGSWLLCKHKDLYGWVRSEYLRAAA